MDPFEPSPSFPPLPLPPLPPVFDPSQPYLLNYAPTEPNAPRVWTVFVAAAVAFVASQIAGGVALVAMVAAQSGGHFETFADFGEAMRVTLGQPQVLLSTGAITQAVLFLTVVCAAILSPLPFVRRLRLNPSTLSPIGYIVAPIGAFAVSILFGSLVTLSGIHTNGTLKFFAELIRKLSPGQVVAAVLIIGVMPAFAEEFLFRGYIQTRLVQRWGRWIGISITALLFGIMHMDLLQGTFALGFGFYIGYLVEKAGSIRPGMVCHAVNNSAQVVLGWLSPAADQEMSRRAATITAVVSLAVIVLCVLYIYFRVHPRQQDAELPPINSLSGLTAMPA